MRISWLISTEAVARRCSVKMVFLEISGWELRFIRKEALAQVFSCEFCEIFKKTFSTKHLFYRIAEACNFIKIRLWRRCFPMNFAKFLRTPFLQSTSSGCFCFYTRGSIGLKWANYLYKSIFFMSLVSFNTSWKHQKTSGCDVFKRCRKRQVAWNRLNLFWMSILCDQIPDQTLKIKR